jgi:hypothetical protein
MTPTTRTQGPASVARDRAAGIGRFGGMLTATVTAAVVFLGGRHYLAPADGPEVLTPTPVTGAPPPPPAAPEAGVAEAADATTSADIAATGETATASSADAAVAKLVEEPAKVAVETDDKTEKTGKAAGAGSDVSAEDKDLARESWRRNKPIITAANGKSMILIPLKGSTDDGSHRYLTKKHTLVITLPKAASLNTLHFNKLNKEGFATLWIDQAETNAKASDGTRLRLVFAEHAVPEVELRDEFVRVTIARPKPARAAPAKAHVEKPEADEEPASDEKPKGKEKDAD